MQKDFIFNYFTEMNKIMMDLDKFISEDNILYSEDSFNKIESLTRKFRKKWQEEMGKLIKGEK